MPLPAYTYSIRSIPALAHVYLIWKIVLLRNESLSGLSPTRRCNFVVEYLMRRSFSASVSEFVRQFYYIDRSNVNALHVLSAV